MTKILIDAIKWAIVFSPLVLTLYAMVGFSHL